MKCRVIQCKVKGQVVDSENPALTAQEALLPSRSPLAAWGSACRCLGRNQTFRCCFCHSGRSLSSGLHARQRNDDGLARESTTTIGEQQESTAFPLFPLLKCLDGTGEPDIAADFSHFPRLSTF